MTFVAWGVWVPDPEYDDGDVIVCPNCRNQCNTNMDTNEFGDEVLRCGDCGYSWVESVEPDDPPVEIELSEF